MFIIQIFNLIKSLCQAFFGPPLTQVFLALYFCTLFRLPHDCHRLVAYHIMLGSTNQEPNII